MSTVRWLSTLSLPHRARTRLLKAWLKGEATPSELRALWDRHGSAAQRAQAASRLAARCRSSGIAVLHPGHRHYPPGFLRLHDPPCVLFARGDPALLHEGVSVTVVGTRRGSDDGRRWAEGIGLGLARAGLQVVSGLAYGVDGAAHRGCLRGGGRPVAVIGTGVDRAYPAGHRRLQREVVEHGCLLSEYPPDTAARPHHFVARNRLLAALGRVLVVVEAGAKSGALCTVDFALQLGREVMVVPGPVDWPSFAGSLRLLREGATCVRGAEDVLEGLGLASSPRAEGPLGLGDRPERPEDIARRLGRDLEGVLSELGRLEAEGQVRRRAGGLYEAARD